MTQRKTAAVAVVLLMMLAHQLGGFLGAHLGGKAFEWAGSYDWHLPIREARPVAAPQAA